MARQIDGCANNVSETIVGTKGQWNSDQYRFTGATNERVRVDREVNPYVQEHIDLLESIVTHKPINELKQVAESTLTAIMGRIRPTPARPSPGTRRSTPSSTPSPRPAGMGAR